MTVEPEYYIIDMRPEWRRHPYITLWRPNNSNYAYPLPWDGKYDKATVDGKAGYYTARNIRADGSFGRSWYRFPVAVDDVKRLAVPKPLAGIIDGNVGPVLPNTADVRRALRRAKYIPALPTTQAEG